MQRRVSSVLVFVLVLVSTGQPAIAQPPPGGPSAHTALSVEQSTAAHVATVDAMVVAVDYIFPAPTVTRVDEYDQVSIPGLPAHGDPGEPVLPFQTARILLPSGTAWQEVEVIPGDKHVVQGTYHVEPGQPLLPTDDSPPPAPVPADTASSDLDMPHPGVLYDVISEQKLTGYAILLVHLYPVQHVPATGALSYYEALTVQVTTAPVAGQVGAQAARMLRALPQDRDRVHTMVDNPQLAEAYPEPAAPGDQVRAASLVGPGDPYEYVLITSDALSATLQSLVDWKNARGLRARIYATEDIYASYAGSDQAEQIRNFVVDAYTTWAATDHPLQYVVLGGDTEVIPIRRVEVNYAGYSANMPVDMYYAGLDGDWDNDGDGEYGEPSGPGESGEEVDFFAEVYVGRLTIETVAEAANIVNKILDYEQNPTASYLDRALWLGRKLDDYTWGGDSKDLISDIVPQYNVTKLYDRDGTYSTSAVINNMNAGTHVVNFDGHGSSTCCPLTPSQVDALTNTEYYLFYNLGCNTAYFDQSSGEAVAEHYVFGTHGAFAYIGNTRYGWYSPGSTNGSGNRLDRLFFTYVDQTAGHNIGKALQLAKEDYYPGHRWSILTLSLFGDPETPLVTELSVPVANVSSPKGGATLKRHVDVVGTARVGDRAGATFGHYVVEYGAGKSPSSWAQVGLTATVPVNEDVLANWDTTMLSDGTYTLRLRVDDGTGSISTDREIVETDNLYITAPDEGELVRGGDVLTITGSALGTDFVDYVLEYGRGTSPGSWSAITTSLTPVTDSVLVAWDTSAIAEADDYTIRLTRHGTAHSSSERVTVYIDPSWQAGWPQAVYRRLVAPSLSVGDVEGDGDLEVVGTAGSYSGSSSYVHVWSHGGTAVSGWPKWLSGARPSAPALADLDRDADLEIVVGTYDAKVYAWHHDGSSVAGWPRSTSGQVFASPAVADLDRDGILEIVAGDVSGSLNAWHYDGTALSGWPQTTTAAIYASPALGDLDGDGDIEVVAAYSDTVHAWHHDGSTVTGWPKATGLTETHASPALGDVDDDGDQEVVAVTGNQVHAWHHDGSTVAGWPKTMGAASKSSPALGDLDGDGDLEIVVGADQVYAWHHDGNAVSGWPATIGQHTNASPVLGDITGDGQADVVIGAGDLDDHVYAWQGDGSVIPGWPHWVFAHDGSGDRFDRLSSPVLVDLDQDGDVEVAIGAEDHVFVFDLPATYSAADLEWPIYGHDLRLTGWYTSGAFGMPPFVQDVQADPWYVVPGSAVTITARVTDEDGVNAVQAEVESPDENVLVTLTLYDDGAHGDGAAGDNVYGNAWTTPGVKQDYVIDITAQDTLALSCTHDNIADFTAQDVPYVRYDSHAVQRENLVSDGVPSPNEFVEGTITLKNIGSLVAPGVTATVSTSDMYVWWWTTGPITFGDVAASSTGTGGDYTFYYQVSHDCPHQHTVTFDLHIEDALGHAWTDSFDVLVVDNVGPEVFGANAWPRTLPAGQPVTITASAHDGSGIATVEAILESPDESPVITLTLYDDGAHGDGIAGDGTYGGVWSTDPQERIYEVDLQTEDMLGNVRQYDNLTEFTTKPFDKAADVLLVVDGGGGMTGQVRPYYTQALDDLNVPFDLWDTYLYGAVPSATMQTYTDGVLIWAVPSWGYLCMSDAQQNLGGYLDAGGKLFVSGQNVGQYINRTGFFGDYLYASYVAASGDLYTLEGIAGDPIGDGIGFGISGGDGADNQYSPDAIAPLTPAATVLTYTTGVTGGIRVDAGTFKVVYFAFGFEGINASSDRAVVMQRVLAWLWSTPPAASLTSSSPDWLGQMTVFTNTSSGATSYLWSFGNGATSTLTNPTYAYGAPGLYTVALTATNAEGSNVATGQVSVYGAPAVNFDATPVLGACPLSVTFSALPTTVPAGDPTLTYQWDFGDGHTDTAVNCTHVFTAAGAYTVTLQVSNLAGTGVLTRTNYVQVSDWYRVYLPLVIRNTE